MMTSTRTKLASAVLALTLAMTACGGAEPEVTVADTAPEAQTTETQATESQTADTDTAAPTEPSNDEAAATDAAPADSAAAGVGEFRAVVTVDGQEMTFDLWQCGETLGNFYAAGVGADGTSADSEIQLAWEEPFPGDGEDARLDNTFAVTIDGVDTWKAGTKQGDVGAGTWGSLDWALDGEVLTGTATLEHTWGPSPGPARQASFVVSCS